MMRFFDAGLVAAGRQAFVVAIVTWAAFVFASRDLGLHGLPGTTNDTEAFPGSNSSLLILAYVLTAIGMAFTSGRSVFRTALRIRCASFLLDRADPMHASRAAAVRFGLSAIMLAALALRTPPGPLVAVCNYFELVPAAWIIWNGTMSVGLACFGASAHAAWRAH